VNTTVEFLYDCPACGAERGPHRYDGDELAWLGWCLPTADGSWRVIEAREVA